AKAGWDAKADGLTAGPPLVIYCSSETHNSVQKAVEILGLGSNALRQIGVDDLFSLADFCSEESLWFHVDGAFGALAALSPRLRPALRGMERADSLAF